MGVSDTVGDLITFNIWSDATKKVLQRSAVRTANPAENAIPNLRIEFEEDAEDTKEPKLVDPENKLDNPELLVPPPRHSISHDRTRKHKVRWHDTHEPPPENLDHFADAQSVMDDLEDDFQPHITSDDLSQSDPRRRKHIRRSCRKAHLLATSACLSIASTMGMNIIDSGQNLHHLGPPIHTVREQHTTFEDPFSLDNPDHILETDMVNSLTLCPPLLFSISSTSNIWIPLKMHVLALHTLRLKLLPTRFLAHLALLWLITLMYTTPIRLNPQRLLPLLNIYVSKLYGKTGRSVGLTHPLCVNNTHGQL